MLENLKLAQTTQYTVEFAHNHSEGIVASAVAGQGPKNVSLARLHAPFERLSVYWTATREGAPPILPSPNSYLQNTNRVFIYGERHGIVCPTLVGHIWQAAGRYDYIVVAPEGLTSQFALATTPWEGNPSDFYIPTANFVPGIISTGLDQFGQMINETGVDANPDVLALNIILQNPLG